MKKIPPFPKLLLATWLHGPYVSLCFVSGKVVDVKLPVRSAKRAKIALGGVGLDADGRGYEISAATLHKYQGDVLAPAAGVWA